MSGRCFSWSAIVLPALCVAAIGLTPAAKGADATNALAFAERFPAVVEKAQPSVVSISTTKTVRRTETGRSPFEFFGPGMPRRSPEQERQPRTREYEQHGLGSGFVVDARGYVVTNYHVVRDVEAKDIKVSFAGSDKEYTAAAVYRDSNTDVAVIKLDGKDFKPLAWGDSDKLRVGEWVMAIGSPLGFDNTVTAGIISATQTRGRVHTQGGRGSLRVTGNPFATEDYLQTDAAINPGNSGGPLVNLKGEVVGVNTLIVSPTRTNAGLGFAIPARIARKVAMELIEKGKVVRGYLGVQIDTPAELIDEKAWEFLRIRNADEALNRFHLKRTDVGVLVLDVLDESPAMKGGLEQGDLITSVHGKKIETTLDLQRTISGMKPDDKVKIVVLRKGRKKELDVVLTAQPTPDDLIARAQGSVEADELGITVQEITPALARVLGLAKAQGVVVTEVADDGPAADAKVQRNDVVLQVGKTKVATIADFTEGLKSLSGEKTVVMLLKSGDDAARWVEIKLAAKAEPKK